MTEIWKDIAGYEGYYQVSTFGRVRSCERHITDSCCERVFSGKILTQTESGGKLPYFYVSLSKNGCVRKMRVHRLVAETFIPNPENKEQVNHIDGDPQNNSVDNLEWVTNAENTQHAYDNGLRTKRVVLIEYNGITQNLHKWCEELGLDYKKTHWRIVYGHWSVDRAFGKGGDDSHVKRRTV